MNTPGPDNDVILRATGLDLGYRRRTVLRGVEMVVRRGERWFIVGPNGEGKTTLLRAFLGLLPTPPDRLYRDPAAMDPRHIGFVPQRCDLNPSLPTTVSEFVTLGLVGQKVGRSEKPERLQATLRQVHLEALADADYFSLSGGQRQRALLARALIRRPRVLLLDEPTGGLDLTAQQALMDVLIERNAQDALTILFVTHDVALAARYATHAALVHGGTVHAGTLEEVFKPELLERVYRLPVRTVRDDHGRLAVYAESSAVSPTAKGAAG